MWLSDKGCIAAVQWLQQINRFYSLASRYAQQEFTLRQRLQTRRSTIARLFGQAQIFAMEARLKEHEAAHSDVVTTMHVFVERLHDLISAEIAQQDPLYAELLVAIAQCKATQMRLAWCMGASMATRYNIVDVLASNETIDYAAINKSLQKLGLAAHGAEALLEGFMRNTTTAVAMSDDALSLEKLKVPSFEVGMATMSVVTTEGLEGILRVLACYEATASEAVQTLVATAQKLRLQQSKQVQSVRYDLELLYK